MINVTLTQAEMAQAVMIGGMRVLDVIRRNMRDTLGEDFGTGRWNRHIEAAGSEIAVARWLNVYMPPDSMRRKASPDVGPVDVRLRTKHGEHLIIRPNDPKGRPYLLVTGVMPTFQIIGWYCVSAGLRHEWLANPGGRMEAWFIPQSELGSPESLLEWVRDQYASV